MRVGDGVDVGVFELTLTKQDVTGPPSVTVTVLLPDVVNLVVNDKDQR